ncbi:hypothetical protein BCE02nite_46410 [Brevibacillus centrosporus]|nr:hypothetical protein BCE02nite_46410 [Brevibacillus centrosporus]
MQKTFQYLVAWDVAALKLHEVRECGIPYVVESDSQGMVAFFFPDIPHRAYNRLRSIFNGYGLFDCHQ